MQGARDEPKTQDYLKDEGSEVVKDMEAENDCEALLVLQNSTPIVEKRWLRKNIFHSTGTIHGQKCTVVIDERSCENIISQTLVDHLKLKVYKQNRPYFVKWLMIGDETHV